jgi:hypothetical protein
MATLGGTTEVEYTQNNIEIDNLALFAVQEHNIKQVFFFLLPFEFCSILCFVSLVKFSIDSRTK